MGRECSTHKSDEKFVQKSDNLKGRYLLGNLGVDGRIILK